MRRSAVNTKNPPLYILERDELPDCPDRVDLTLDRMVGRSLADLEVAVQEVGQHENAKQGCEHPCDLSGT